MEICALWFFRQETTSAGTNLLGGRAITRNLEGSAAKSLKSCLMQNSQCNGEVYPGYSLIRKCCRHFKFLLHTYIKEEIREEGIVRRLPPFLRFLEIAGY